MFRPLRSTISMKYSETIVKPSNIELIRQSLPNSYTYAAYRALVSTLVQERGTTGTEQKESLIEYTQLNDRRMKRWDKTLKIPEAIERKVKGLDRKILWVVLTESWCGDASPSLPVMNRLAQMTPNLDLKIVLRDENTQLMNRFLTDGSLSIPKLISLDLHTGEILATWGPRPSTATKMAHEYKKKHGSLTPEFKEGLQLWYNKDKGQNILSDLLKLLALK